MAPVTWDRAPVIDRSWHWSPVTGQTSKSLIITGLFFFFSSKDSSSSTSCHHRYNRINI
ncbi:hypothetical protein DPMN_094245 [Dreissena polymorpha]|uniref:Uncharacterized protein n=1 Tax=Dreissena polymorpha TaxID=45954 RepID=A0A9D4R3D2_DREPO|nr:hypothetical protein DPMN_094245 [Dreissena polymorpha]